MSKLRRGTYQGGFNGLVGAVRYLDLETGEAYSDPEGTDRQWTFKVRSADGIWRDGARWFSIDEPHAPVSPQDSGQKFDGGKDEPSLLMQGCNLAVAGVIAVLGFGFRKYGKRNGWKEVPEARRRYKDALYRHLAAIERGELYDNEPGGSGKPHWDHVACNAMFLSQMHHEASDPK